MDTDELDELVRKRDRLNARSAELQRRITDIRLARSEQRKSKDQAEQIDKWKTECHRAQEEARRHKRMLAALLVGSGLGEDVVAQYLGVTRQTVRKYVGWYRFRDIGDCVRRWVYAAE
jgi:predicted transcriptional regulator